MDLSVIIPVYNEEESLKELYKQLHTTLKKLQSSYEIIMVDDGSRDASLYIMKEICMNDSSVKVLSLKRNFGKTAALACGIDHSKGNIFIFIDADLQNDPDDIPKLLQKLNEGYDLINGWRRKRKDPLFTRKIPSVIANKLISFMGGLQLHDYGCALKVCRKNIIKNIKLFGEMHRFIPLLATWAGARVTEIEVNHRPRKFGKSKYGLTRVLRVLFDLLTVKILTNFSPRSIYLIDGLGIFSLIFGIGVIFFIFFRFIVAGKLYINILFFLLICIQFILIGFLLDMIAKVYQKSQGKQIYLIKEKINF